MIHPLNLTHAGLTPHEPLTLQRFQGITGQTSTSQLLPNLSLTVMDILMTFDFMVSSNIVLTQSASPDFFWLECFFAEASEQDMERTREFLAAAHLTVT